MKVLQLLSVALLLTTGFVGCAGVKNTMRLSEKDSEWNPVAKLKADKEEKAEPAEAATMTVVWKESVYQKPGEPSKRGFGGRVFFYDANNNAVEAPGDLKVYGFDESIKDKPEPSPDKIFEFTNEDMKTLVSDSGLGTSYSIWCPWDKVGGVRKTVALIPMFKTADGRVLRGGQSIGVLHGKAPKQTDDVSATQGYKVLGSSPALISQATYSSVAKVNSPEVAQAGYQSEAQKRERDRTTTIRMSPATAQRLATLRERANKISGNLVNAQQSQASSIQVRSEEVVSGKLKDSPRSRGWADGLRSQQSSSDTNAIEESATSKRPVFGAPGSFN